MPKLKTKKGAAKRFKITESGKVKKNKAFRGHILTKKSAKPDYVSSGEKKTVKQMLPYG